MQSESNELLNPTGDAAVLAPGGLATVAPNAEETPAPLQAEPGIAVPMRKPWRLLFRAVLWLLWADIAVVAVLGGWRLRTYAWEQTESIRYTDDINNAFRIGTDAARVGVLNYYDYCDRLQEQGDAHNVNYAPVRLLIAIQWARWAGPRINPPGTLDMFADRFFYQRALLLGPTYALCRPMLVFNSIMELLAAAGIFVLVRHWTRGRWWTGAENAVGLLAAAALWFNPALICDAHCWPQWDAWLLPFLVWAMVAASWEMWFVAGLLIAVGAMFKGQMLLGAPVLLLWPMWRGKWWAVLREIIGFVAGAAMCASVWLLRRDGAVIGSALVWLIGIGVALAILQLQRRTSNRYIKGAAIGIGAIFFVWPMVAMGLAAMAWAVLAGGLVIVGATLLPFRAQGFVATACLSIALFLCVPIFGGSMAWYHIGIVSGTHMEGMHLGPTCNLPAILESQWGWGEMDTVATLPAGRFADVFGAAMTALDRGFTYTPGVALDVPLKLVLFPAYFLTLILCGLGAAVQDRRRSPKILLALVAPWVLLFALLPQMHERYLMWGAALCAVTVAISPGWFLLGVMITAISWSQQLLLMMQVNNQPDAPLLRFINGSTPGVGWALVLASLIFLYGAIAPGRFARLR